MIPFIQHSKWQNYRHREQMSGCQGWGRREKERGGYGYERDPCDRTVLVCGVEHANVYTWWNCTALNTTHTSAHMHVKSVRYEEAQWITSVWTAGYNTELSFSNSKMFPLMETGWGVCRISALCFTADMNLQYTLRQKSPIYLRLPIPPFSSPGVTTVAVFLHTLPEIICSLST